jgi:hypothetical protein
MQRDRRVDRDRRRADAALGAIEGERAAERRPGEQGLLGRETGEQALDPGEQFGRMERFDQVVVGTGTQATDLLLDLALGGEHDDRDVAGAPLLCPDLRRHLVAVELGEHDVEEDEIGRLGAPQAESFRAVRRDDDVVALLLEGVLQEPLHIRVVVDDEDLGRHQSSTGLARSGTSTGSAKVSGDRSPGAPIIGPVSRPDPYERRRWSVTRDS